MRTISLFTLAAVLPWAVSADVVSSGAASDIDSLRTTWGVKGVGISVIRGADTQYITLGNASDTAPISQDTLFPLASLSKVFVVYALEKLISSGVQAGGKPVDWQTPVASILGGDWQLPDDYATKTTTLLDLASMRYGQPSHDGALRDISTVDAVRQLRDLPMTSTIREGFQYSNPAYTTLSRVVEVLTKQSYPDYSVGMLKAWGAQEPYYNLSAAEATGRLAVGHYRVRSDAACASSTSPTPDPQCLGEAYPLPNWLGTGHDSLNLAGSVGLIASLPDVQKMQRFMVAHPEDQPIIPNWLRDPGGSDQIYGKGQVIQTYKGVRLVGHNGGLPGHSEQMWHAPDANVSISVFATDSEFSQLTIAMFYTVLEDVLNLPKTDWKTAVFNRIKAQSGRPSPDGHGAPLTGAYCQKGYGQLVFKPAEDRLIKLLPPGVSKVNATTAALPDSIYTHSITLTPVDGAFYNWTAAMDRYDPPLLAPIGGAKGTVVVTPNGIGFFGSFANAGNVPQYPPSTENVENRAQVWFARCDIQNSTTAPNSQGNQNQNKQ